MEKAEEEDMGLVGSWLGIRDDREGKLGYIPAGSCEKPVINKERASLSIRELVKPVWRRPENGSMQEGEERRARPKPMAHLHESYLVPCKAKEDRKH